MTTQSNLPLPPEPVISCNLQNLKFEFNGTASGANTRIEYKLVDRMAGKEVKSSVVLHGRLAPEEVADLSDALEPGGIFEVGDTGLPDLAEKMPMSWVENGRAVHFISRISFTDASGPRYLPTAEQFVNAFAPYSPD